MKTSKTKLAIGLSLGFILFNFSAFAQQEQSLGFTTEIWQSNLTNPALLPEKKVHVMLPSVYFNVKSDYAINDFVKIDPETGRRQIIDTFVLAKLSNSNKANSNLNIQTLGLSIPIGSKLRLSLHQAIIADGAVDISGDLARVIVKGNTQFNGKTVALGSSINANSHSELALGAAYTFSAFSIGVRVKYLAGSQAVFTPNSKANVKFDNEAQKLTAETDFKMLSFGFTGDGASNTSIFTNNTGFAFDLGGVFTLGKLKLSASILDIGGSISWKEDPRTFASTSNTTYSGANIPNFFQASSYNGNSYADSLKKYFNYSDTKTGTYTQNLPLRIYISGLYELNDKWRVGALIYNENGGFITSSSALSFDITRKFGSIFTLGATGAYRNSSLSNIGVHGTLKLGPIQLYGMTDNIVPLLGYRNAKTLNGRVGLNLVF